MKRYLRECFTDYFYETWQYAIRQINKQYPKAIQTWNEIAFNLLNQQATKVNLWWSISLENGKARGTYYNTKSISNTATVFQL